MKQGKHSIRRKLSSELVAERAGISSVTPWNIEKGSFSVAMGAYAAAVHTLNGITGHIRSVEIYLIIRTELYIINKGDMHGNEIGKGHCQ